MIFVQAILSVLLLLHALRLGDCIPNCNISVSEPVYAILRSNSTVNHNETKLQCALTVIVVVELNKSKSDCVYPINVVQLLALYGTGRKPEITQKRLKYSQINTSGKFEDSIEFCVTEADWFDLATDPPPYFLKFIYKPGYWSNKGCVISEEDCGRDTNASLVRVEYDNPPTVQFNITSGKTVLLQSESTNSVFADSRHLNWSVDSLSASKSQSDSWVEVAVHLFDPDVFDELPEADKFRYSAVTSVNVTVKKTLVFSKAVNQSEVIKQTTFIESCLIRWNDSTKIIHLQECSQPFEIASRNKSYLTIFYRSDLADLHEKLLQALPAGRNYADNITEVNVNASYKLHARVTTGSLRPQRSSDIFTLCWKLPKAVLSERHENNRRSWDVKQCRIFEKHKHQIYYAIIVLYCLSAVLALVIIWMHSAVNKREALILKIRKQLRKRNLNVPDNIRELVQKTTLSLPEVTFSAIPRRHERQGRQSCHNRTRTQSDQVKVFCSYTARRCMPESNEMTEENATIETTRQVKDSRVEKNKSVTIDKRTKLQFD